MNSHAVLLSLRLIHIVAGMLWVGGATMLAGYVVPVARAGDAGLAALRELIWVRDLPRALNVLLVLALLSGSALYGNVLVLTRGQFARSHAGLAFGVGGVAAVVAAGIATWGAAPAVHAALRLAEGGERAAAAAALRRYERGMRLVVALLFVTAATMATARYL